MERSARPRLFLVPVLLTGAALAASPGTALSQSRDTPVRGGSEAERPFRVDTRAGVAFPTGDMRDYVDEGPVLGAGLAYRLDDRWSVRADWTAALMRPADRTPLRNAGVDIPVRGSETDLHHVTGGVQVELSEPKRADIEVRAHAGAGVTFLSTEETELAEGGNFAQITFDLRLELAVPLAEHIRFIGRGDLYVLPVHASGPDHLGKEVTLPFSGGLAVSL